MHAAAADSPLLKAFHRAGDEIVREPQFFICEGPEMLDILGELLQNSQRNEESDDQTEVFHDFPSFSMTFSESSPMFTVHLGTDGQWHTRELVKDLGHLPQDLTVVGHLKFCDDFIRDQLTYIYILYIYISNDYGMIIDYSHSGWWLSHPSEKYEFVNGKDYPMYEMENKKCSKPPTIYIYIQYKI